MRIKMLLVLISSLTVSSPLFAVTTSDLLPETVTQTHPDFSAIYDSVGKSVVNISVVQGANQAANPLFGGGDPMLDYFFKRMPQPQAPANKQRGLGSGFILSSDGYILTNAHVVDNASSVTVKLSDKREFKAKIIGVDLSTDVAMLKIAATNLPVVKIGDPNRLKAGNWVVAIGSPFGLENTITQGIVSALSRNLPDDSSVPFIQTDVPVNPGNSGGPLINLQGEVVGINSQIYSKSGGYMGISFAIPIDYAMRIAEQLKTTGKAVHGRLGIAIQPLTEELAASFGLSSPTGALVNGVDQGSAAEKAGIQVGDVILKINGKEVVETAILQQIVSNLGPNKPVNLTIWRNNQKLNLTATTMAANQQLAAETSNLPSAKAKSSTVTLDKLGLVIKPLNATQLAQLGAKIRAGLVVQQASSDAQFSGVVNGDIIIGVANTPISSLEQFMALINRVPVGKSLALKILRRRGSEWLVLFIPLTVINPQAD